jgi:MFS family permease
MSDIKSRNATLLAAISAIACCEIAIGFMTQIIPLTMDADGISARLIGFNTAMGQLGVFLCGLALPLMTRRVSSRTIVLASIALLILTLLLFAFTRPLYAWYAIRFANGFGIAALFTLSETWITVAAGTARRARVMGIYTTVLTISFGVVPFIIGVTGFSTALPWLIGAASLSLGFLVVFSIRGEAPDATDKGQGFLNVLRRAPALYICILVTTTFEAISLTFFTIYGMRNGMTYVTASQVLGAGIVGCLLFFYPIGQLADYWSRGRTAIICASVAVVCAVLTAWTIATPAIWPVTILVRAGAFGVYIVAMTAIGDSFDGTDLVSASALVAMAWGVGGMIGAPLAGIVIDQMGINALPWMMAGCYAIALLAMALNNWQLAPLDSKVEAQ